MSNSEFRVEHEPRPRKTPQTYRVIRDGGGVREALARAAETAAADDDQDDDDAISDPPRTERPFRWC
jgi:hypothetical protein